MHISDFIDGLEADENLRLEIAEHRFNKPLKARFANIGIDERLLEALESQGLENLYTHQCEAVEHLRDGRNVVAMTPTGSGKSLIYNIPVLESVLQDPESRALYVFPLKGLEQDQLKNLGELVGRLGIENAGAVYDGDTTAYKRKKIRDNLPNVVFTNPDMLHLAINAFH
jgi:DEAD/DEAH box helicase domain-containing protein